MTRCRSQHLIVALAFIVAAVAVLAVGLDPQSAGTVEGEAVGAVEGIVGRDVGGARFQIAASVYLTGLPANTKMSHSKVVAEIGRAHVCTPVTNAHLVCRLLVEKTN